MNFANHENSLFLKHSVWFYLDQCFQRHCFSFVNWVCFTASEKLVTPVKVMKAFSELYFNLATTKCHVACLRSKIFLINKHATLPQSQTACDSEVLLTSAKMVLCSWPHNFFLRQQAIVTKSIMVHQLSSFAFFCCETKKQKWCYQTAVHFLKDEVYDQSFFKNVAQTFCFANITCFHLFCIKLSIYITKFFKLLSNCIALAGFREDRWSSCAKCGALHIYHARDMLPKCSNPMLVWSKGGLVKAVGLEKLDDCVCDECCGLHRLLSVYSG